MFFAEVTISGDLVCRHRMYVFSVGISSVSKIALFGGMFTSLLIISVTYIACNHIMKL